MPTTEVVVPDHTEALRQLVHDRLYGELRDHHLMEATSSEYAYMVRWERTETQESGTHRVLLPTGETRGREEPVAIWGNYFRGRDHLKLSLRDYLDRIGYAPAAKLAKIEN